VFLLFFFKFFLQLLVLRVELLVHGVHVVRPDRGQEHLDLLVKLLADRVLLDNGVLRPPPDHLLQSLGHRGKERVRERRLRHEVDLLVELLAHTTPVLLEAARHDLPEVLRELLLALRLLAELARHLLPLVLDRLLADLPRPLRREELGVTVGLDEGHKVALLEAVRADEPPVADEGLEDLDLHLLDLGIGRRRRVVLGEFGGDARHQKDAERAEDESTGHLLVRQDSQ